jgi:hypothetical protein
MVARIGDRPLDTQETATSRARIWVRLIGAGVTNPIELSCLKPGGLLMAANDGRFTRRTDPRVRRWRVAWLLIVLIGIAGGVIATRWVGAHRGFAEASARPVVPSPQPDPTTR